VDDDARLADAGQPVSWCAVGRERTGSVVEVVIEIYRGWRDHRVARLGAGLAYYGLFALVPLVTVMVIVADLLVDYDAVIAFVATPLADLLGQDVDQVAAALIDRIPSDGASSTLGLVGVAALVVSASLLFLALQDALNVIWDSPVQPGFGRTVRRRALAFVIVLTTSGIAIVSVAIQTVVGWLRHAIPDDHLAVALATQVVSRLVPVAVTAIALSLLYALLPYAPVDHRAAMVGGLVTAVCLAVGVVVVGGVLQRTASASVQGAAGSLFVLLTGLYVQSQIVLVGGEATRVLSQRWDGQPRSDLDLADPAPTADDGGRR
jgi:membrane protein